MVQIGLPIQKSFGIRHVNPSRFDLRRSTGGKTEAEREAEFQRREMHWLTVHFPIHWNRSRLTPNQ